MRNKGEIAMKDEENWLEDLSLKIQEVINGHEHSQILAVLGNIFTEVLIETTKGSPGQQTAFNAILMEFVKTSLDHYESWEKENGSHQRRKYENFKFYRKI